MPDLPSLKLIKCYLSKRGIWIKTNIHSSWSFDVLSVPLLVHYYSMFSYVTSKDDIGNYTDDKTPYSTGNRIHNIISELGQASDILTKWFIDNYSKANPNKHHVLLSGASDIQLIVENVPVASSSCEKLLGIKIDPKLSFESHVESLCKKPVKNSMHCHGCSFS